MHGLIGFRDISLKPALRHMIKKFRSTFVQDCYKLRESCLFISPKQKIYQMLQICIIWYVANVSFFGVTPGRKFKLNEYNSFVDLKYKVHNLPPYGDNRKIVELEYCSPSIDNEWRIEFYNFEFKTDVDVSAMWNTFFRFEKKFRSSWKQWFQDWPKILWTCWSVHLDIEM